MFPMFLREKSLKIGKKVQKVKLLLHRDSSCNRDIMLLLRTLQAFSSCYKLLKATKFPLSLVVKFGN